jgi:hypothetical protein
VTATSGERSTGFLVGYFATVEAINDHGRLIDLADLVIESTGTDRDA